MFRYPLHSTKNSIVCDVRNQVVAVVCGTNPADKQRRAAFICNSLNHPFNAAWDEARKQASVALAAGDEKANEFWIRLAGSLRKAQDKAQAVRHG